MSNDAAWKHLTLYPAVTISSNRSRNNEHFQHNGQPSPPHYTYDYGNLTLTPSATYNSNTLHKPQISPYDSISNTSDIQTPTVSIQHTPTHSQANRSHTYNNDLSLYNLHSNTNNQTHYFTTHSVTHSPSHSVSESFSKSNKKKKEKSPGHKFANEFWKKARVKQVMRGATIIGQFEAKLMLSYFRNVEADNIESTDMALRYLESKTVRTLKRTLREMNETIRRTFLYGADFNYAHEQHLLGNDDTEILGPITENIATKTQDNELKVPDIDAITMPSPNVINLADLANDSFSSLDDYLQSPNTTYTPSANPQDPENCFDNINNIHINSNNSNNSNDDENFDPLKGAANVNIKPNTPLHFKRNFGKKINDKKSNDKKNKDEDELPSTLPQIDEQHSFWSDKGDKGINNKRLSNASNTNTKMFGKYFDKRGSNISHNSIWSESDGSDNNEMDSDDDDPYVLTAFGSSGSNVFDDRSSVASTINTHSKSSTRNLEIAKHSNKPPAKAGKEHISQFSFASTVSLGSNHTSTMSNILTIEEDTEFEQNKNDLDKLVANTSLKAHKKTLKKRTYSNGKEIKDIKDTPLPDANHKLKLLKIDSALLMPENQPSVKHDTNYSLDSFLSDMELPSPTDVEKLKYHLTEPRLPPSRRKTYNYSQF